MIMKNKYYVPSIEEFCVGFRYERYIEVDYETTDGVSGWMKITYPNDIFIGNYLGKKLDFKTLRTKYLDKKDIEELGWIQSKLGWCYYSLPNYISHVLQHNLELNHVSIKWYHPDDSKGDVIFVGTIKNYNELKKIMEMLNIK